MSPLVQSLGGALCGLMIERAAPSTDAEAVALCTVAHEIAVVAVRTPRPGRAAALLAAIGWHEGRWRHDKLGDHGRSCSTYQVQRGRERCAVLLAEPVLAAEEALAAAELSMGACRRGPELHVLAAYASGRCSAGHLESARMVRTWHRWTPRLVAAAEGR